MRRLTFLARDGREALRAGLATFLRSSSANKAFDTHDHIALT
jgi:hypothetical protein